MVGTPQMKLGWMIAGGPESARNEAMTRLDLIADNFLSVGTPVQYALPGLLAAREGVQRQILLIPEIVEMDEATVERLLARGEELDSFGLAIESFGPVRKRQSALSRAYSAR